jgi:small subunit ribosomal protein S17
MIEVEETQKDRGSRKERLGIVMSDSMDKTVSVAVSALVPHPRYRKRVRRSKKFLAHDENNSARAGDTVRIVETRPFSARKRWRLVEIVSRAE